MALEEKRALDEILIRCNSQTNGGHDGISIRYRTWIEKDGAEMPGTSALESPQPADWDTAAVTDRIGELPASQAVQIQALQAQVAQLTSERDAALQQLATAQEASET